MDQTNKRVAKNAIMLTLRMVLVTIVGLYTSRIVLEALGVDDYGIYGVVGGVVGMASFLNAAMAGATSRFITFELGRGGGNRLQSIFSTSLLIHFGIALVVVVLAETIGLWFLNHKMVIPPDRMSAANVLFQFSVLSMVVGFTQVPYQADIIAHEKMSIYAYFEIINVTLKLLIVYLLLVIDGDRLIWYAGMVLAVSVLSAMFYRWYCIHNFAEARLSLRFDRSVAREMLTFSGYDLYGNMCVVARNQGQPIVLNLFFGVVANAGASIALTVTGAISGLTSSIMQAFNPQIVKQYAAGSYDHMAQMMRRSAQFTLLAYATIAIPVMLLTPQLLQLWLGQVPRYSALFIQLVIVATMVDIMVMVNNAAIKATGRIKRLSFISGTFYLLAPVLSYLWLKFFGGSVAVTYIMNIAILLVVVVIGWWILKTQIPQFAIRKYVFALMRSILAIAASLAIATIIKQTAFADITADTQWWQTLISLALFGIISALVLAPITFAIAFSKAERQFFILKLKSIITRK